METSKIEIRCDRCGKQALCDENPETRAAIRPIGVAKIFIKVREPQMTRESSRDLCDGCTAEFERFMKGERLGGSCDR